MSTTAQPTARAATLAVRSLTKRFGERAALNEVSFELGRRRGPRRDRPQRGRQDDAVVDPRRDPAPSHGEVASVPPDARLGWVPQQPALYSKLSVAENLRLFARLEKRLSDPEAAVAQMLEQTGLSERADDEVGVLTGGILQRVNIAIGLLCEPVALLLDEPSSSLDPRQRARLWEFIASLAARGTSVVFSTHNVAEAERYAERVLVLGDGELLFAGTPTELEQAVGLAVRDLEAAFVRFLRERGH